MKSLITIAKEMGFIPDPKMTKEDWGYLVDSIKTYLLHTDNGLSRDDEAEQKRRLSLGDLPNLLYYTNCLQKRGGVENVVKNNIAALKSPKNSDIFAASQTIPGNLETTSYIWHHPYNINDNSRKECFTVDINIGSRIFPDMLKKLDAFAHRYQSSFKITNFHTRHRVDTLNFYMTRDITPEIAQEFYAIVKPCLKSTHHDRLNGQEIYIGQTPVKGIKIGPILNGSQSSFEYRETQKDQWLIRDITNPDLRELADAYLKNWVGEAPKSDGTVLSQPSLGGVSSSIEVMNLMYYMLGKEGRNPFQLVGYDNKPYQKHIILTEEKEQTKMADSIWKKMTSFLHKDKKQTYNPDKDFEDSHLWSDVKLRNAEGVCYGHRINITSFTAEERKSLKEMLSKYHIQYTERQATTNSADIHPGDLTIRVTDPDSVRQLRSRVFKWAEGPHTRPVFKTNAEYDAEQKMIHEKRSVSVSLGEKPKWADKRYWEKLCGTEKGYVMDLGTAARYNDLGQPEGAPFDAEVVIKELAKKGIQAEKCASGFGNYLPSYKMTHDSLVILGEKNTEKFEQMYLKEEQNLSPYAIRGQGGER